MKRRNFLRIAGSSSVILAANSSIISCSSISDSAANRPWYIAGSGYNEPRLRALSWAILAPNPHNRQPWLVTLGEQMSLSLSIDIRKVLPETDPFNRQILIGLGCFSELLAMAAAEDGYQLEFNWFPDGVVDEKGLLDGRAIANVNFIKGGKPKPLFKQVLKRRSYKQTFENKPISNPTLTEIGLAQSIGSTLNMSNATHFIQQMRKLTVAAMEIELTTERTYLESMNLLRIGTDEVRANPDGIPLDGYTFMWLRMLGIFTHEDSKNLHSAASKRARKDLLEIIDSSQAYLWITTPGNSRRDQIAAGHTYLRANLKVTELGLKMHPISQSLQEYDEMRDIANSVNQLVAIKHPERLQMLARIGYGEETKASPRWPIDKFIVG